MKAGELKKDARRARDAFTEAYMDYYPLVFGTVRSRVDSLTDAEDLVQEIFLIFYNKLGEIENPRQWLFGTMRNVLYRYYSSRKGEGINVDDVLDHAALTFVNGFRDTRILIKEAMDAVECDEADRALLDLIATHHFSYNRVADLTGKTRRQVEYRYGLLVRKITDYLSERGVKNLEELL